MTSGIPPDSTSSLLHFMHLFTLDNFISFLRHISLFRAYLSSHAKVNEELQIAREVLMDSLDSACVDLGSFCDILEDIRSDIVLPSGLERVFTCFIY